MISPPVPVSPKPTETSMFPDFPPAACPVNILNAPDEPELVVPVENSRDPLTPDAPALTLLIVI